MGYPFGGVPLFDAGGVTASFNLVVNSGAAWGVLQGQALGLFLLRVGLVAAVAGYGVWKKRLFRWPIWAIGIGALGNGLDYLLYGAVVDFIHFQFFGASFPLFNVADSLISLGALGLLMQRNPQDHSADASSPIHS
jgi:signal peptidase II